MMSEYEDRKRELIGQIVLNHLDQSVEDLLETFSDDPEALSFFRTTPLGQLVGLGTKRRKRVKNGAPRTRRSAKNDEAVARKQKAKTIRDQFAGDAAKSKGNSKGKLKAPPKTGKPHDGIAEIDDTVAKFCKGRPSSQKRDIMKATGVSDAQFRGAIMRLIEAGTIERTGSGRGAKYAVA
jgi:hypothetical protein